MEEAFVAFGLFRSGFSGKTGHKIHCHTDGVDHLVFGRTRVGIQTFEVNLHHSGVKGFRFKAAQFITVKGVGVLSTEFGDVKVFCTAADFFIRRDGKAKLSVGHFGMFNKVAGRFNNNGDTGLVVST